MGSLNVDRIEVKEGLSGESIGHTLEGIEGTDEDGEAVGRAGVAFWSWHFPLVIKTSSI